MLVSHIAHVSDAIPCHKLRKSEMRDASILVRLHKHIAPTVRYMNSQWQEWCESLQAHFQHAKISVHNFKAKVVFFRCGSHTHSFCIHNHFFLLFGSHAEFTEFHSEQFFFLASLRFSKFTFLSTSFSINRIVSIFLFRLLQFDVLAIIKR